MLCRVAAEQEGVDLVDDQHGLGVFGLGEHAADVLLGFSNVHIQYVARPPGERLPFQGLRQVQGELALSRARRTVEEDMSGRLTSIAQKVEYMVCLVRVDEKVLQGYGLCVYRGEELF